MGLTDPFSHWLDPFWYCLDPIWAPEKDESLKSKRFLCWRTEYWLNGSQQRPWQRAQMPYIVAPRGPSPLVPQTQQGQVMSCHNVLTLKYLRRRTSGSYHVEASSTRILGKSRICEASDGKYYKKQTKENANPKTARKNQYQIVL